MICSVSEGDAGHCLKIDERGLLLITMDGRPATFKAGWLPRLGYVGLASFIILELVHTSRTRAVWFLDRDARYLAGSPTALPDRLRELLRIEAQATIEQIVAGFLTNVDFAGDDAYRDFFAINPQTRADLLALTTLASALPTPHAMEAFGEDVLITTPAGTTTLPNRQLAATLAARLEERYAAACRTGSMSIPSPVDGVELSDVRGFVLSHVLALWRCVDRRNKLVFFIAASGFGSARTTMWLPGAGLYLYVTSTEFGRIDLTSGGYVKAMIDHLFEHGQDLLEFLRRPVGRFAQFTWPPPSLHIGHYHWNELPGLERIIEVLEPHDYPLVYDLGGGSGSSFYGKLSSLFPELADRIDLSCSDFRDMSRHAYNRGIQLFRFGGRHVSSRLRKRIATVVSMTPVARDARAATGDATGPVIVVGLRVENRTLVDQGQFYVRLARRVAEQFGSVTIIIDGHNSKDSVAGAKTFDSHLAQRAKRSPVEVERQLAAEITEGLKDHLACVVDCVGMTLLDNLAWMRTADYCVAPWGAGLAKYRWALNLPTYVLTSNYCKTRKGDIGIYHSPQDMEDPSRHMFISEALVTDRPDLVPLIEMGGAMTPYFMNYEIDMDAAITEILQELSQLPSHKTRWSRTLSP